MENTVDIDVEFEGGQLSFPATFISTAYNYKWRFLINDITIIFEPDEEGKYRAAFQSMETIDISTLNLELIKAIATTLDHLFD